MKMTNTTKIGVLDSTIKRREDHQKDIKKSPIVQTLNEYASVSVIHGLSYIFSEGQSMKERILWLIIVCSALAFTVYQLPDFYLEWQEHPIITVLDTVALPIEDIKFPAVTICPQGSAKDIMDAVLYKQLKEYILKEQGNSSEVTGSNRKKREARSELSQDEIDQWVSNFFKDVYPGIRVKPTELIQLLTSDSPDKRIENVEIFSPETEKDCEESFNDAAADLIPSLSDKTCPDGFEMLDDEHCIHVSEQLTAHGEAEFYCNAKTYGSGRLLHLETLEKIQSFHKYMVKGEKSEGI